MHPTADTPALMCINHSGRRVEKAFEARDPSLVRLKIEPLYDGLRSDPRYMQLLRRINLTPDFSRK